MFSKNSVVGVVAGVSALAMGTALGEEKKVVLKGIVILDVDRTITCGLSAGDGDCKGPQNSSANVFRQAALGGSPLPFKGCRDGAYYFPDSGPDSGPDSKQGVPYALRTGRDVQDFLNTYARNEKGWLTAIASHSGDDLTVNQPGCNISKYDFVKNGALKGHTLGWGDKQCTQIDEDGKVVNGGHQDNLCVHSPWAGQKSPGATKDVMVRFLLKSLDTLMDKDPHFKAFEFGENFEVRFIDDEVNNHKAVLLDHNNNAQVYKFNKGKIVSSTCAFYPNHFTASYQGSAQCYDADLKCEKPIRDYDQSTGIQKKHFTQTLAAMKSTKDFQHSPPSVKWDTYNPKKVTPKSDPVQTECNPIL